MCEYAGNLLSSGVATSHHALFKATGQASCARLESICDTQQSSLLLQKGRTAVGHWQWAHELVTTSVLLLPLYDLLMPSSTDAF
jgi:hypothetical protein